MVASSLYNEDRLTTLLRQHFGFNSFRPMQLEIINENLAGHNLIALLPTGGGKSLCYQLPAMVREGLTVVVSPLIALMKDQVDSLNELGIPATFLNSSLSSEQGKVIWRDLHQKRYKILYLAPERLMLDGMFESLQQWGVSSFAIDEAHCISEWGHDFRPEYRKLSNLRDNFPKVPIMALTATATERVRNDIVSLLQIKNSRLFVASFNRPNLSYRIVPRANPVKQIKEIVEQNIGESGIVYCLTRARTEELAEKLTKLGFPALAYHAGLSNKEREHRQNQFIQDKVSIIVATVAFGMGIDKPDVRYVVHHDLPKNIESYYQETGRAGRDGLPSECVLLYSPADSGKLHYFINQISDPKEQEIARQHLTKLIAFCESSSCRRIGILSYFGEVFVDSKGGELTACGACDNCLTPRELFNGTEPALMILSCIKRIFRHSKFNVGMQHLVDVLMGANTDKIRRWNHQEISTYGIGNKRTRAEWIYFCRELIRVGLITQNSERYNVIEVTPLGERVLKERSEIQIREPILSAKLEVEVRRTQRAKTGAIEYDQGLFERLRIWRRDLASQRRVPAYVIFHDTTLQEIARAKPTSERALGLLSGIGEKKLSQYGSQILQIVKNN